MARGSGSDTDRVDEGAHDSLRRQAARLTIVMILDKGGVQ
jgi:hypothetical protein